MLVTRVTGFSTPPNCTSEWCRVKTWATLVWSRKVLSVCRLTFRSLLLTRLMTGTQLLMTKLSIVRSIQLILRVSRIGVVLSRVCSLARVWVSLRWMATRRRCLMKKLALLQVTWLFLRRVAPVIMNSRLLQILIPGARWVRSVLLIVSGRRLNVARRWCSLVLLGLVRLT